MEKVIEDLCKKLDQLANQIIAVWAADTTYLEGIGWMGPAFNRNDLASFATILSSDLRDPSLQFTQGQLDIAKRITPTIDIFRSSTVPQMSNSNIGQAIPAYINTINFLRNQLLPRFPAKMLDWTNVEEAKQIPASIVRRAIAADKILNKYEPQLADVSNKIEKINEAYSVSDELPIVLDQLNSAKEDYLKSTKEINTLLAQAQVSETAIKKLHEKMVASQVEAEKIVQRCNDSFKATTSIGLAGAFETKANDLYWSMRWWVVILVLALIGGSVIGWHNLDILNTALSSETIIWPVVAIRSVFSLLSLGAPLWLAWLATKQIGQRFRLAEDYAFKASISKAYEGYRQEAARLDPAFESRLFGSALTRLDEAPLRLVETHSHGGPLHEVANSEALQKVIAMFPDKESFTNALNSLTETAKSGVKAVTEAVSTAAKAESDKPS